MSIATGQRPPDPLRGFKFRVQIDGIQKMGFREVSGLDMGTDAVDYREGDGDTIRKLAGLQKFSNITLKRGITTDQDIWTWRKPHESPHFRLGYCYGGPGRNSARSRLLCLVYPRDPSAEPCRPAKLADAGARFLASNSTALKSPDIK
jgi:hypothetical protein